MTITARVQNGRLVLDEPTPLPEGSVGELKVIDGDNLDDEERGRLHASIEEGLEDADAGRVISADESLRDLRAMRCVSK